MSTQEYDLIRAVKNVPDLQALFRVFSCDSFSPSSATAGYVSTGCRRSVISNHVACRAGGSP